MRKVICNTICAPNFTIKIEKGKEERNIKCNK